jgi:hypothetical protein
VKPVGCVPAVMKLYPHAAARTPIGPVVGVHRGHGQISNHAWHTPGCGAGGWQGVPAVCYMPKQVMTSVPPHAAPKGAPKLPHEEGLGEEPTGRLQGPTKLKHTSCVQQAWLAGIATETPAPH